MITAKKINILTETEDDLPLSGTLKDVSSNTIAYMKRKLKAIDFVPLGYSNYILLCTQDIDVIISRSLSSKEILSSLILPYVSSFIETFPRNRYEASFRTYNDRVSIKIYSIDHQLKILLNQVGISSLVHDPNLFSFDIYYYRSEGTVADIYLRLESKILTDVFRRLDSQSYSIENPLSFMESCVDEVLYCFTFLLKALRLTEFAEKT